MSRETDARARAEAQHYLLQYWQLWNRYTQFTQRRQIARKL